MKSTKFEAQGEHQIRHNRCVLQEKVFMRSIVKGAPKKIYFTHTTHL